MAETLASSGKADSGGGSIKTDVSTIPRARRGSGTRSRILIDLFVYILSEPCRIDSWCAGKCGHQHPGRHCHAAADRHELPDRHTIARDDVGLAAVEPAHDFTALIPKGPLCDDLRHRTNVARVRQDGASGGSARSARRLRSVASPYGHYGPPTPRSQLTKGRRQCLIEGWPALLGYWR